MRCITLGPFETNCYLLHDPGGEDCLVIDPGLEPEPLIETIASSGLKLRSVLLTHGHVDHIAGCAALVEGTQAPVRIHTGDLFLYRGLVEHARMFGFRLEPAPEPAAALEGGELVRFGGGELQVIHTPGHSPGGVCLRLRTDGEADRVFCGDTIFRDSFGRTDLPGGSIEQLVHSITALLFRMPAETVLFPGHGPASTVEREARSNMILGFSQAGYRDW